MNTVNIYHDVKSGRCDCGGQFTASQSFPATIPTQTYSIPKCNTCGVFPKFYLISVHGYDMDARRQRFRIRYSKEGRRLTDPYDCIYVLRRISDELKSGEFDIRRYQSLTSRDTYLFENYLAKYKADCQKRLEGTMRPVLTPNGYKFKERQWKHLLLHFTGVDIGTLKKIHIERFRKLFPGSMDSLNKALSELRTILTEACKEDMISKLPDLGTIGKSRERTTIMTLDEGLRIIEHIKNPQYKAMLKLLSIYPVRPCEIPVLKWKNVDFKKGEITFETHISFKEVIPGRKSRKQGEKYASLTLPLTPEAEFLIRSISRDLNPEGYIFKGARNKFVSLGTLNEAWIEAVKLAGFKPNEKTKYHKYELKHARISEMHKRPGSDLKLLEEASGVDYQTLMKRYVRNTESEVRDFFLSH